MAVVFLTPPKKTHLPVTTCENDHWSYQMLYATCLTQSVTDPTINRIESESITHLALSLWKTYTRAWFITNPVLFLYVSISWICHLRCCIKNVYGCCNGKFLVFLDSACCHKILLRDYSMSVENRAAITNQISDTNIACARHRTLSFDDETHNPTACLDQCVTQTFRLLSSSEDS